MESALNSEHQGELQKYLQFFKLKRGEAVSEANVAIQQCKDSNLRDEIYSKEDVEQAVDALGEEMKNTLESELQNIVRMSGVYISSLMSQGEKSGLEMKGDVSFLEDHKALEEMKRIETGQKAAPLQPLDKPVKTQGARLPTLQAGFNNDPAIVSELNDTKQEVKKIQERFNQV